jgi:uncharacterized membrane protein YfcA
MTTIVATFLLAGMVKGVIGLGLPTVVLGLLTAVLDLPTAMALLIVPSLVTNAYQASVGGNGRVIITRVWPFLLMASIMVWVGANALTRINLDILSGLLGILLISYAVINLVGIRITIPARHESWAGLAFGAVNGILTGMTGSFLVPGVMFLQAIGLPRDMLIQAMGMLFTASTMALALALRSNNLMAGNSVVASAFLLGPALIGMFVGIALRKRLSETRFRQVFFSAIPVLGLYIVIQAFN